MTEFFTKISGAIAGPILLGAFFPVVLFLTALTLIVLPITPFGHDLTAAVKNPSVWQSNTTAALVLTIVVLVLSIVLHNLNIPVIRLYEGYPWQSSWIGVLCANRRKGRLIRAKLLRERVRKLRKEIRLNESFLHAANMDLSGVIAAQRELDRLVNFSYPDRNESVLPTGLGNVIRAFETYPRRQYGASAIALWPRLAGVLDGAVAQSLDSAKTAFDFMIHSAFLSGVLMALELAAGLYWKTPLVYGLSEAWIGWTVIFGVLSFLFYLAAMNRAQEWGTQVVSAFDLYRHTLLKKLGYELSLSGVTDERRVWDILSYKFAFPDDKSYPDLPYKLPATYLVVEPVSTKVEFVRSMRLSEGGSIHVRVIVRNTDPTASPADNVVLREEIPAGKSYVRDTATVDGNAAILLGIDPLQIHIGPVEYDEERAVEFTMKAKATP
jgi:hypothetical protein